MKFEIWEEKFKACKNNYNVHELDTPIMLEFKTVNHVFTTFSGE